MKKRVKIPFYVSQLILKSGKLHDIAEELILPSAIIIVNVLNNDKTVKDLSIIPLYKDTVTRRINDLLWNIKEQLLERVCISPSFFSTAGLKYL